MKRMMLPLWALLLVVACSDNPSSADDGLPESSSSSKIESSSSTKAESSSSSKIASSSSNKIASSSSSSRHSKPDPESSSSSSKKKKSSSSSVTLSSSSETLSSSSSSCHSEPEPESSSSSSHHSGPDPESSSSEVLSDPSKIFEIRKPKPDVLPCEVPWGGETMTESFPQHDVICTYDYNGEQGFLYVQLTPTSCGGGMSITPGRYDVDKAELYVNGKFGDVSNIEYEWGGNHHVEYLQFTYKRNVFRYSQSTMGWGGRPCQSMDCLKVFESDGKTYVENGCNERSLPIVCRTVNEKGKVADFTDNYKVCEGDPRTLGYEVEY